MTTTGSKIHVDVTLDEDTITLSSSVTLESHPDFKHLLNPSTHEGDTFQHVMELRPINAFVLRYLLKDYQPRITAEDAQLLGEQANRVPFPRAELSEAKTHIDLTLPGLTVYRDIPIRLGAYPLKSGKYRLALAKLHELQAITNTATSLPPMLFSKELHNMLVRPIEGFDGTLESLKNISVNELSVVSANVQSYKKRTDKTVAEKMASMGIATLYDLLVWLPKRYIDKSSPQQLNDLLPNEPATIVGKISSLSARNDATIFVIETGRANLVKVTFWRQPWLKGKFKVGQEVLITGKLNLYRGERQLTGVSVEGMEEASMMPIVPVYKQSESKGITSVFLTAAVREMFSRMTDIELPAYLAGEGRINYSSAFRELHLPTSLKTHEDVVNSLAYYEMVDMQVIIQEQREMSRNRAGIPQPKTSRNLQELAVEALPFKLTDQQANAVQELNDKLADVVPSSTLLNADVGAGKTVVAQLACLRAVEAGYQAVLLGPTDVLARQLYATLERLVEPLKAAGAEVNIAYLSGGMKVSEKKPILKAVAEGQIDILVGTHSVISKVEYSNLGFVAVDEQQKFGAEQRSKLLASRNDGRVPDILMQSATPIPRSVAQVFYGDVDMILLTGKPPGRIPIVTEWLQEDPNVLLEQQVTPLWEEIAQEASAGHQTFVITPLVVDSPAIDAASVELAHERLSKTIFPSMNVGIVHGKMKAEQQREVMADFRAKKYDILVASTVVEVGVDIPDATRVVVLSAERLGASSLHQIRGRVGRNSLPSKCYLVSQGNSENSAYRLQSLVENSDGFEVAKADLVSRGEGTMFSGNQSGASEAVFLSLARHGRWVKRAAEEARDILSGPLREEAIRESRNRFSTEGRLV